MARRYTSVGEQNAAALVSIMALTAASTIRPVLNEVIFGCAAAPADNAFRMLLGRINATGTGTAVTPQKWDPGDPASLATVATDHSVEPTYTFDGQVMAEWPVNQQATIRWSVPPEEGLVAPAISANGFGLRFWSVSGGTALCQSTFIHEE